MWGPELCYGAGRSKGTFGDTVPPEVDIHLPPAAHLEGLPLPHHPLLRKTFQGEALLLLLLKPGDMQDSWGLQEGGQKQTRVCL